MTEPTLYFNFFAELKLLKEQKRVRLALKRRDGNDKNHVSENMKVAKSIQVLNDTRLEQH